MKVLIYKLLVAINVRAMRMLCPYAPHYLWSDMKGDVDTRLRVRQLGGRPVKQELPVMKGFTTI